MADSSPFWIQADEARRRRAREWGIRIGIAVLAFAAGAVLVAGGI